METLLSAALSYATRGWRVFPAHGMRKGKCTCGRECGERAGKHPRITEWGKRATREEGEIRKWWRRWPDANVAVATGSGLVVVDVDSKEQLAEVGEIPETLCSSTGRGVHLWFTGEGHGMRGNILVRGEGGYVIAPPSLHRSGRRYAWVREAPLAPLPERFKSTPALTAPALGAPPPWLPPGDKVEAEPSLPLTAENRARVEGALGALNPACKREQWVRGMMAVHSLQWVLPDGTDLGLELYDRFSRGALNGGHIPPNYAGREDVERVWHSLRRHGVGIGTLFHLACNSRDAPLGKLTGKTSSTSVPIVTQTGRIEGESGTRGEPGETPEAPPAVLVTFPDRDKAQRPKATCRNARAALVGLGVACRYDQYHERLEAGGQVLGQWAGELSDSTVLLLRRLIEEAWGFDPTTQATRDAAEQLCLEHAFDPVADYLASLKWDGRERLRGWLHDYCGAEESALNAEVGRLVLIAAVRRVRVPGCKWDHVLVLEGEKGVGKSSAVAILAGEGNFSDQLILGHDERAQQELIRGVWIYEIAELAGMRRAEVEKVKAFCSRTHDRTRPAYGRYRVDKARRGIFIATTNEARYLKDDTGERRFWPVRVRKVDLAGLRRDRDQIWAEAAVSEANGVPLALEEGLWGAAAEEQEKRFDVDPWEGIVEVWAEGKNRFTTVDVMQGALLMSNLEMDRGKQTRVGNILRRLGYSAVRGAYGTSRTRQYSKL